MTLMFKVGRQYGSRNALPRHISDTCKSCLCTNNYIISVLKCVKADIRVKDTKYDIL